MKRGMAGVLAAVFLITGLVMLTGCQGEKGVPEKRQRLSANGIETYDHGYMRKDLTALELVHLMGNGINLGNTMEAWGRPALGLTADVSAYETFWGQPVTTQEMISAMKEAGFDSLRIPVAWTNTMDYENGDYTIREDYLDRVEEIINYALNEDMYVMVNAHWDGGWWGMFGSANPETRKAGMDLYISMWTQIAERYKEYSDYLMFVSANEELGDRLNEIHVVPDSNTLSRDECYEITNLINQTFVDTVRGTGGNNEERFLIIAGYNTDIEHTIDDRFVMPNDSAVSKLLLAVHYYNPWGYTGGPSISRWGTRDEFEEQNYLLEKMTKFTEQGYGVVFGEYMVHLAADGTIKENATDFINNFLDNMDLYGYVPMLWDHDTSFVKSGEPGFFDVDLAALFAGRSRDARADWTREEIEAAARRSMASALRRAEERDRTAIAAGELAKIDADTAIAWIMFNSNDWAITYSVGDVYQSNSKTDGLEALDAFITESGTYTVSLDFTGTGAGYAVSTAFSALGIYNGELLFPDYIVSIRDVLVNGESYELNGEPFTTSDDSITTRVNLYNGWVSQIPPEARTMDDSRENLSATILDNQDPELQRIETLEVTFDYGPRM
ncbi:glycoside hydrolase family 5 protein [Spirochaeta dissipatitropha]